MSVIFLRLKNFISVVLEWGQTGVYKGAYPTTVVRSEEMARSGKTAGKPSQLRIIGGKWRGRKLTFTPEQGLRPTTDRVRETLFNWLAPHIVGARCADLFAGSGALGLEALSRGATHCDFVDTSRTALAQIRAQLTQLDCATAAACHLASAEQFMRERDGHYDIVFIDPPFGLGLAGPTCAQLDAQGRLSASALVYVEMAAAEAAPDTPLAWTLHRDKTAGDVAYRLFTTGQ